MAVLLSAHALSLAARVVTLIACEDVSSVLHLNICDSPHCGEMTGHFPLCPPSLPDHRLVLLLCKALPRR